MSEDGPPGNTGGRVAPPLVGFGDQTKSRTSLGDQTEKECGARLRGVRVAGFSGVRVARGEASAERRSEGDGCKLWSRCRDTPLLLLLSLVSKH